MGDQPRLAFSSGLLACRPGGRTEGSISTGPEQIFCRMNSKRLRALNPGQDGWHLLPVPSVFFSKPLLELLVFESDHDHAGDHRKQSQPIANRQYRADAPGQHLAEMSQIDRMANVGADARRHQPVIAMPGHNFRKGAELASAEPCSGTPVDSECR